MKTSDFFYDLPKELIAQSPAAVRSASRLLVYDRANKTIRDGVFTDILDYFRPGDVLVRNITRVIPARLHAYREDTGGAMEFLLLRRLDENRWECLVRPGRRAKTGLTFKINDELSATILDSTEDGGRIVRLNYDGVFEEILDRAGEMPLPPYITERTAGKERYQTVYAKENGSAAAPTAMALEQSIVLPPPTDTGGRKRRTAKKAQADAAEAPRPRAWITRRRSTEPGHEARFEEWHGPARTGSVLEKVFISLGASPEQAKLSRLWRSWDAVLGPDLAPLARPLGHPDGKL